MKTSSRAKPARVIDPVCGMEVAADSSLDAVHEGETYHFCSERCRQSFVDDPGRYDPRGRPGEGAAGGGAGPEHAQADEVHRRVESRGQSLSDYLPLVVIVVLSMVAAAAKQYAYAGEWESRAWMHDFMGFFLVMFSMFKFFDLSGFADGFQMYDLLAKRLRAYAYMYPFIELGLGVGYLARWNLPIVYGITIAVMVFGALGVIRALRKDLDLNCACMGTVLRVPLSTVALTEDLGMVAMAAVMWATL